MPNCRPPADKEHIGDNFMVHSDPQYRQSWRDLGWADSTKADDFWITLGLSNGRGLQKFVNQNFGKVKFIATALVSLFASPAAGAAFSSFSSGLQNQIKTALNSGAQGLANKLPDLLKQGHIELGARQFSDLVKLPALLPEAEETSMKGAYNRIITTSAKNQFHRHALLKRLFGWLYDNYGYLKKLDFTSTLQAKQTYTVVLAVRSLYDDPAFRPDIMDCLPAGKEYLASPIFPRWINEYTDDNFSGLERWGNIGRILHVMEIYSDETAFNDAMNHAAGTVDPDAKGDPLTVALIAVGAGAAL